MYQAGSSISPEAFSSRPSSRNLTREFFFSIFQGIVIAESHHVCLLCQGHLLNQKSWLQSDQEKAGSLRSIY